MITRTRPSWERESWQQQLQHVMTDARALLDTVNLPELMDHIIPDPAFPIRVPLAFVSKMRKGDPNDPLLRQVLPLREELQRHAGFSQDPLAEASCSPHPGILHKYESRALIVTTQHCAVHCRYCFRREFPYDAHRENAQWGALWQYIEHKPLINEIILSGGDPLSLPNRSLEKLITELGQRPQITRLRIHSRLPVMIPERVDDELLTLLANTTLNVVLVHHSNHAQELDSRFRDANQRLQQAGVHLLNQSVLLRGINDTADTLTELSERLFDCHTLPYYLHLLDPVTGTQHFDVDEKSAKKLIQEVSKRLPGFLVPKLTREQAGEPHKTVLA